MKAKKLLEVINLSVSFKTSLGEVHAVRDVNFDLSEGETLAIVGESGSGKSVTTKAITQLLPEENAVIKDGKILFRGKDLLRLNKKQMPKVRGKDIAMIFQDPMTALDPTMVIGKQIIETLRIHQHLTKEEAEKKAVNLLTAVRIPNAEHQLKRYPHQFSGGMRQRIMIAIALACNPQLLIADEPTTALDVTIQADILDLLKELQGKMGTSIIFITHDLGVVAKIADRIAVMYAGKIVEIGTANEIFYYPQHPYTWALLCSIPTLDDNEKELLSIPGSPPNLLLPLKGDAFAPRNQFAISRDWKEEPPMFKVSPTHFAATWLLDRSSPRVKPPREIRRRYEIYHANCEDDGYD